MENPLTRSAEKIARARNMLAFGASRAQTWRQLQDQRERVERKRMLIFLALVVL